MSLSRLSLLSLTFCAVAWADSPESAPGQEKILKLDTLVVSAGLDAKSAFDLAQGTTILLGDDLARRTQATLGDTLADVPGISATSYGPGASRPIIRGLGGDRIRILANSIGSLDASNISPDHNVALEPLFATRIEVLRGPATLLYGSSAIGGAINVIDNSIPEAAGDGRLHGSLEARAFGAASERTGVLSTQAGDSRLTVQINALDQHTDDVSIPGVARIDADAPADQLDGTLPSSALDTRSLSVGGTSFWSAGHVGAAVSRYTTDYGVPTGDDPAITIRMQHNRLDLHGEATQPFAIFRSARLRLGFGDYQHSEVEGGEIGTTFHNRAWEGRLELPHEPLGALTGTIGVQASGSDFSATGEEVVTPAYETGNAAVFALEELQAGPLAWQFGLRAEKQRIRLGAVSDELPVVTGYSAATGETKHDTGYSASSGLVWHPARDWSLGLSFSYSERLPTAQERFSNGPHGGTGSYEIGTSSLGLEKSTGLEINLRKRAGFVTGSLGAFVNRFHDYIYEEELSADTVPAENNPEELTVYQFIAKDAEFYGAEAELQFHLYEGKDRHLHLELGADSVHAEQTTDHVPLPRMPPWRTTLALRYDDARWQTGVEWRHAAAQDRVAPGETTTDAYNLLNADISYLIPAGRSSWELFARANNLTDETARVSTSFLKDYAPLPGRNLLVGVRLHF